MGLFKNRAEDVRRATLKSYEFRMSDIWTQRDPTSPEAARQIMADFHTGAVVGACRRVYLDKGTAIEPKELTREFWSRTCATYGLGDPEAAPNPWSLGP